MGRFDILRKKSGKFTFRLMGANGQLLLSSESFGTRSAAQSAVKDVVESADTESNFERRENSQGDYYFVLKSPSGRILAKSDVFASEAGRETGIWAVKRNAREPAAAS